MIHLVVLPLEPTFLNRRGACWSLSHKTHAPDDGVMGWEGGGRKGKKGKKIASNALFFLQKSVNWRGGDSKVA